jgi:hypothetical protein
VRRTGPDTAQVLSTLDTAALPDGVIYKPCGNRRASACPACSQRYKRDAYQIVRAGLVGGKDARRELSVCPHGTRLVCFARHEPGDACLGTPLCLDCYDHDAHVAWNLHAAATAGAFRPGWIRPSASPILPAQKAPVRY